MNKELGTSSKIVNENKNSSLFIVNSSQNSTIDQLEQLKIQPQELGGSQPHFMEWIKSRTWHVMLLDQEMTNYNDMGESDIPHLDSSVGSSLESDGSACSSSDCNMDDH